jgi:acyl carrier protein
VDDLGVDSLELVKVVMRLEEWIALEIPDADTAKNRTVHDGVDYIQRHAKSVQQ